MNKRTFLKTSALATAAALVNPFKLISNTLTPDLGPVEPFVLGNFELPALPYAPDALEPHIDKMTMEIHHGRHHNAYVSNLNKGVDGTAYANMNIEQIMEAVKPGDAAVRNNGGGHYNHTLFWKLMKPNGGGAPTGRMADFINAKFGSFDQLKTQFNGAAAGRFGSGWAWLCVNRKGELFITSTPNQDNPLMRKIVKKDYGFPILGIDVWEHAYYLKYQNRRGDYVGAFWNVVNWDEVNTQYDLAMRKFGK